MPEVITLPPLRSFGPRKPTIYLPLFFPIKPHPGCYSGTILIYDDDTILIVMIASFSVVQFVPIGD